jgi:hypothetical protein
MYCPDMMDEIICEAVSGSIRQAEMRGERRRAFWKKRGR